MKFDPSYSEAYATFFTSQAGMYYLTTLRELIDSEHEKAEARSDLAAHHASKAGGIREAIKHIESVTKEQMP